MTESNYSFAVSRAEDGGFESGGLRSFFEYRDLGIKKVTGGTVGAHVIRAAKPCGDGTGVHHHALGFQMVYVLKGSCQFWYEGQGTVDLAAGDCVHAPPGIVHELRSCTDDCEMLEVTMPAEFATEAQES